MSKHMQSSPAAFARCPRCHAPILRGLVEGIPLAVDREPITSVTAELAVRLAGRRTYDRLHDGELVYRNEYRIVRRTLPVHAEHLCESRDAE